MGRRKDSNPQVGKETHKVKCGIDDDCDSLVGDTRRDSVLAPASDFGSSKRIREGGRTIGAGPISDIIKRVNNSEDNEDDETKYNNREYNKEFKVHKKDTKDGLPEFPMEISLKQGDEQSKAPGDYVDENGNMLYKRALDAFQNTHVKMNVEAIRETIEGGKKSEVAKRVLRDIVENKLACEDCAGVENLPEYELEKLAKAEEKIRKETWKIRVDNDRVKAKRVVKKKLFWIFSVDVEEEAEINLQGEIENVKKPWWDIFAW